MATMKGILQRIERPFNMRLNRLAITWHIAAVLLTCHSFAAAKVIDLPNHKAKEALIGIKVGNHHPKRAK